jgi:hypothetical protein
LEREREERAERECAMIIEPLIEVGHIYALLPDRAPFRVEVVIGSVAYGKVKYQGKWKKWDALIKNLTLLTEEEKKDA